MRSLTASSNSQDLPIVSRVCCSPADFAPRILYHGRLEAIEPRQCLPPDLPAKCIVFFDTLLGDDSPEEVLARELGHHKLRHLWKTRRGLFAFPRLLWTLGSSLIDLGHDGLGVSSHGSATALILFLLVAGLHLLFPPLLSCLLRTRIRSRRLFRRARQSREPRRAPGEIPTWTTPPPSP